MLNKNDKIFIQKIVDEYNSGVSARRLNAKYHIQCEKILKSNTAFYQIMNLIKNIDLIE